MTDHQQFTITVPTETVSRIEAHLDTTEFETVDEYLAFVIEEVAYQVREKSGADSDAASDTTVSDTEVKNRLESLGYLDT